MARPPLFAFVLAGVAGFAKAGPEDVLNLTAAEFHKHIESNKRTLVQFYAPWCGNCKKLAPEYEKAAGILRGQYIPLVKIDAIEEKDLAFNYSVKGYPTLFWFEDGQEMPFDGHRTSDGIVEWVKSMLGAAVTNGEPATQPAKEKPQMVLYSDGMLPAFLEAAKRKRRKADWHFVQQSTWYPKIVLKHLNEQPLELTGYATGKRDKILAFLEDNHMPLFGPLDADTWDQYVLSGKGLVWSLFPNEPGGISATQAKHRPMMEEVARKFMGKYHVTFTDTENFKEVIDNVMPIQKFPSIAVHKKILDKKRYVYDGEMVAWKIADFIREVDAGRVAPTLRTEPVPPETDEDGVKTVVGTNFVQEVFTPDRDVFLEVRAPWCGHCKKLEPDFQQLAKTIKTEGLSDLLKVVWIDGTANDCPVENMDWTNFPMIYFVKAGKKEPMLYEGERQFRSFWRFVKRHATKADEIQQRLEKKKDKTDRAQEL